jgi:hypothetical protein
MRVLLIDEEAKEKVAQVMSYARQHILPPRHRYQSAGRPHCMVLAEELTQ